MAYRKKIRVLIVDDSMVFREILSRGLSIDPNIEVVATANDPFEARDKLIKYKPDVMTCDIEMPRMNGIDFVKRLMPQYPLPIIIVSTVSGAVFDAVEAGAIDFVSKPDIRLASSVERFIHNMILKVKIAASSKVANINNKQGSYHLPHLTNDSQAKIIAIGASTGGTEAIARILKELPDNSPGILIVQHIPPDFSKMFADRLNNTTNLNVKEAESGDYIRAGHALVAPGDRHMKIVKVGRNYKIECFEGEKVNGHCPSVDILFESVAKEIGDKAIGVILTGMGYDGAKGLLAMRRKGAKTIGQDEESSVVYGMPKVAFNIGAVEKQVALSNIAQTLYTIIK